MQLSFYFSPGSRYSYLALTQLPELERNMGVQFHWVPVMGARVRELRGTDPFAGPPQSEQYNWEYRRRDAEAWAAYYGVSFIEPRQHLVDAEMLGRAAIAAAQLGNIRDYPVALATEVYGKGTWPIDQQVAVETAQRQGLDQDQFREILQSATCARTLEDNCVQAVNRGVFGTPTFLVDDALIWGNDRLPLVQHALSNG